ncbi:helix-turn-helix domain-containing protein [Streptomyces griseoviridis]|uniref:helix-turn-helix transcriptional regulator n=1 Tax=Streptomyces griseoviridis TaxID=45398 RepID=UPI003450A41E
MPIEYTPATSSTAPGRQSEVPPVTLERQRNAPADGQSCLIDNAWYSTKHLASRLHVDASTLRRWRTARPPQGPPFVALSDRHVLYSALDVEDWLRTRRTCPGRSS